jgi:hypothetical protein
MRQRTKKTIRYKSYCKYLPSPIINDNNQQKLPVLNNQPTQTSSSPIDKKCCPTTIRRDTIHGAALFIETKRKLLVLQKKATFVVYHRGTCSEIFFVSVKFERTNDQKQIKQITINQQPNPFRLWRHRQHYHCWLYHCWLLFPTVCVTKWNAHMRSIYFVRPVPSR